MTVSVTVLDNSCKEGVRNRCNVASTTAATRADSSSDTSGWSPS